MIGGGGKVAGGARVMVLVLLRAHGIVLAAGGAHAQ